jgi:Peptidase family C25
MSDKMLITNCAALKKKYGAQGFQDVRKAITALIAADKQRGLTTQLVDIANAAQMKKFKGSAVSSAKSERQAKNAVDAIHAAVKPDYLVILDGPDVVPHLALDNPMPKDDDPDVPSDLPYASDAPFTRRDPARYAAVTRVVGRIPGITGARTAAFLIKQINAAAAFKPRKRDNYLPNFAISAEVWEKSTALSIENIFGNDKMRICPPTGTPAVAKMLSGLSHFINCHGAGVDPKFYGQRGDQFPVAMTSDDVAKGARRNTIVAAECCYGAQLYDPSWADGKLPISNAYLGAGAVAFLGSTNIAYGPAEGNGAADLLTQYFLINILAGASLGRACLEARQKFVLGEKMEDPVNVKTLAQFILLADPSLHTCPAAAPDSKSAVIDPAAARATRRVFLAAAGKAAADSSGFPGKKVARPSRKVQTLVQKIARQRGFRAGSKDLDAFHVVGGESYGQELKARGVEQKVVTITEEPKVPRKRAKRRPKGVGLTRIFVAHVHDNRVIEVADYVRR